MGVGIKGGFMLIKRRGSLSVPAGQSPHPEADDILCAALYSRLSGDELFAVPDQRVTSDTEGQSRQ